MIEAVLGLRYNTIDPVGNGDMFHFHESSNPQCPAGGDIRAPLDDRLKAIQGVMDEEMREDTLLICVPGQRSLLRETGI